MNAPNYLAARYDIIRSLGEASHDKLYLARDQSRSGLPVALKTFSKGELKAKSAFFRECEALHQIHHPNIAALLDWGETENDFYYVMEFIEGRDIVREARTRDWKSVFQLIAQSAWALGEIHERGISHRNLKPESLLVGRVLQNNHESATERLSLKVLNFGLNRAPSSTSRFSNHNLPYLAPEILSGKASDHRADLYSFGVVLYHLALGKLPHLPKGSFADYLEALKEGDIDWELLRGPETPRGVFECIRRLVLPDPERRLRSAAEVLRCLNHYEGEHFPLCTPRAAPQALSEAAGHPDPKIPSGAPPEHYLKHLLELSRCGKKSEALSFAEPLLPQIHQWRNPTLVADFLAAYLYLLAESGRIDDAQNLLSTLYEHPALKAQPNLEYFLTGAYLAFRQGRRREAKALLEKTPEAILRKAPAAKRARFENYLGLCAQAERNIAKAACHYERASEHAHEAKRRDQEASFSASAAGLYFDLNRWSKAYLLYQSALGITRELRNRSLEASILHHLGKLYLHFGRWHEAEGALIRSLDLARHQGMKSLIANNLYLMTVAEEGRGNPEKVEDYLNQAQSHAESLGETEILLQIQLARAHQEADRGRRSEAEAALAKLRQSAETANRPSFLLQGEWLRAKMAIGQGRYNETWIATTLENVREDAAGHALNHWLWQVHIDLGDLERLKGNFEEAASSYQRAEEVLTELLQEVPESYRESFLRDRKKDRLHRSRLALESSKKGTGEETTAKDIPMPPVEEPGFAGLSFSRWTEMNRRILKNHLSQSVLEEILDAAISLTDAERGFVVLSEQDTLEVRAFRNLNPQILESDAMSFGRGIAQEVLRQGTPQTFLDALNDARIPHTPLCAESPLRSLLCVPISASARIRGLIYLDNLVRPGVFTADHLPLLEALASQASLALEHVKLHEENTRAIKELTQSKSLIQKLNASLERDLEATQAKLSSLQKELQLQNQAPASQNIDEALFAGGLDPQIEHLEKRAILHALDKVQGNKVQAAKLLKISRRTLYLKMTAFRIDKRYGKSPSRQNP